MAVRLVRNIYLHWKHQVVVTNMHEPNGLGVAKALDVPDSLRCEVDP